MGGGKFEITQTKYRLTEEQKHDDGEKLFDFCAECLQTFIETNMADVAEPGAERSADESLHQGEALIKPGQELPLGFTVSHVLSCVAFMLIAFLVLLPLRVSTAVNPVLHAPALMDILPVKTGSTMVN